MLKSWDLQYCTIFTKIKVLHCLNISWIFSQSMSILSYIMQNTVDVMYIILYIKNEQIKWKQFIFVRYHDSCVDNKETALNPGAHFSSLLINENGALFVLKTCSDTLFHQWFS